MEGSDDDAGGGGEVGNEVTGEDDGASVAGELVGASVALANGSILPQPRKKIRARTEMCPAFLNDEFIGLQIQRRRLVTYIF
mmetsp:Transcript_32320/g.95226  ORF Transcript_32320/g.95226 Transcript_32320/m.95226 type:complete len:82 (+) Transcript_32320:511-756(+)